MTKNRERFKTHTLPTHTGKKKKTILKIGSEPQNIKNKKQKNKTQRENKRKKNDIDCCNSSQSVSSSSQ
jgi:hypothetical protein